MLLRKEELNWGYHVFIVQPRLQDIRSASRHMQDSATVHECVHHLSVCRGLCTDLL